ncbi:hypothetical protein DFH28DRAFT_922184 [Melampsora americana]|nr:hypothetical protein DFH28DRAFT_922184 [Melampsora americana]
MSSNVIQDVTAAMGALTPATITVASTTTTQPVASLGEARKEGGTSLNASSGSGSSFGRYNRQMLISNYLNRGTAGGNNPKEKNRKPFTVTDSNPKIGKAEIDPKTELTIHRHRPKHCRYG